MGFLKKYGELSKILISVLLLIILLYASYSILSSRWDKTLVERENYGHGRIGDSINVYHHEFYEILEPKIQMISIFYILAQLIFFIYFSIKHLKSREHIFWIAPYLLVVLTGYLGFLYLPLQQSSCGCGYISINIMFYFWLYLIFYYITSLLLIVPLYIIYQKKGKYKKTNSNSTPNNRK